MSGLDSVFFSIDSKNGIIFNADSLPKGTNITKLRTSIKFYNTVSQVEYQMENGSHRIGTANYMDDPNDTIDFTGDVILHVVNSTGDISMDYRVKVNVHQMEPDSLAWSEMAVASLPSRMENPTAQKAVAFGENVCSLISEKDGSLTMAQAGKDTQWIKSALNLPFTPEIETLTASENSLYLLDNQGNLYSSADGLSWQATGVKWIAITGGYGEAVLGVKSDATGMWHTSYPESAEIQDTKLEEDFPIKKISTFYTISSRWASLPTGIFFGGLDVLGRYQSAVWAFDGTMWAKLSENTLPELAGATLFPYFNFRHASSGNSTLTEFPVWMIIGGTLSDNSFNRTTYISYDNGVNWHQASESLQLPDYIPGMTQADAFIATYTLSGSLSGWAQRPAPKFPAGARIKYDIDGNDISWECPYIYLFGGYNANGLLCNSIWRGAINRLTFRPIF